VLTFKALSDCFLIYFLTSLNFVCMLNCVIICLIIDLIMVGDCSVMVVGVCLMRKTMEVHLSLQGCFL
jgi:hypothetical protein